MSPEDFLLRINEKRKAWNQGEDEKILDFIISLQTLFKRLKKPLTESEQISIAFNNLLPRYQLYIRPSGITSLNQLVEDGQRFEWIQDRTKTFRPPPAKDKCLVTEAAYVPTEKSSVPRSKPKPSMASLKRAPGDQPLAQSHGKAKKPTPSTARVKDKSTGKSPSNRSDTLICWNCLSTSHRYPECSKPRDKLFCYHCGTKGFTRRNCLDPPFSPEFPKENY